MNAFSPTAEHLLPLSAMQEGMYFHSVYEGEGVDVYAVQMGLEFDGVIDADRLRGACAGVVGRHEILRSAYSATSSGRVVQVVSRELDLDWVYEDLSGLADPDRSLEEWLEADQIDRFDLARPPLIRFALLRLAQGRHVLVVTAHHILVDGWSMPLVFRDLLAIYSGLDRELPAPVPFRDFLAWLAGRDDEAAETAWAEALDGVSGPCLVAPGLESSRAVMPRRTVLEVPPDLANSIAVTARERGLTLSTVFQGVWALLLSQVTGERDVVFGATVSGRPPDLEGVEEIVGLLINTIPVRVRIDPRQSLADLLADVQRAHAQLIDHHHYGLTHIHRITGTRQLFDTALVFENYPLGAVADLVDARRDAPAVMAEGLRVTGGLGHDAFHYPLRLLAAADRSMSIQLDYRADVFDEQEASRMQAFVLAVLRHFVGDPGARVSEIVLACAPVEWQFPNSEAPAGGVSGSNASRSNSEAWLRRLFGEVLGVEAVGRDDDFFVLGGNSLAAVTLAARIRLDLGLPFPTRAIFAGPTPASLARALAQSPAQQLREGEHHAEPV